MRFRFGLRSLAVLVTTVCIALWAVPAAIEWYEWRLIRAVVVDTMAQVAASPHKPTMYTGFARHSQYCLANVEVEWNSLSSSGALITEKPRSDAIFVEMPGKVRAWVHSPDEAMRLLREND
jgi:hypothetical protein